MPPLRGARPRSSSSRGSSAARPISATARRRSRPASPPRCAPTTTRSARTAATTTRSRAASPMAPVYAELFGRASGLMGGKGGSMHLTERGARRDGLVRHRRRPPADRGRSRLVGAVPRLRPGGGLLLRRRRDEHRRVPRGAEPGRRLEGAGRLRLREQPVHGVHADRGGDRGRAAGRRPCAAYGLRADRGRRQRRRGGLRHRAPDDRPGPGRRWPVAGRGPDVPPRRALARRPGQVPAGRRGRGVARQGPDPRRAGAPARARRRRGRPSTAIEAEAQAEVAAAEAEARAAPEPTPRRRSRPQVWADGGSAWRN